MSNLRNDSIKTAQSKILVLGATGGGFRTLAAEYAAPFFKRPASETLHNSRLGGCHHMIDLDCNAQRTTPSDLLATHRRQRWRGLARFVETVAKSGLAPQ